MRAPLAYTMIRSVSAAILGAWVAVGAHAPAWANVITDWDEKAVAFLQPRMVPPVAYRAMAIVHIAMFDAVNSIEPLYRPYYAQHPAMGETSKDAAAAAAAGAVLTQLLPDVSSEIQAALSSYLSAIPESDAKSNGVKLGETVAAKILEARANDGSSTADAYRPVTTPGTYIPTALTVAPQWPDLMPFAMTSPSQFRPKPPIALESDQWAKDYNEIKELGAKNSGKRSPRQTEDARFWLLTGPLSTHPLHRQVAMRKEMSVIDSARFMAVITAAEADAMIAVLDAKYKYGFWRPITAIRNGDIDGNAATEREATWQPIDNTPMHPEYPCAHCIVSSAVASAVEAMLGTADIPEVTMTSPMAPGVTHRWTNLHAYAEEVSAARIAAGFHYRFSTVVGEDMGRQIGIHAVKTIMQPLRSTSAR
jgi:PAP2 superfamily/Vanadium chloroperoxidase N-terminal domain